MSIRPLPIDADGARLAGALHVADGPVGALIVSGAPQGRFGAHRGFVALAGALAAAGVSTLRFDRRGIGDSDGHDPGFAHIAADIVAARAALRAACPQVRHVIGIGLCDGAAALALDPRGFDALILLNPWTRDTEEAGDLPPAAAIAQRYRARLASPAAWVRLLTGRVDLKRALRGLAHITRADPLTTTAQAVAAALARFPGPVAILLAQRDNTAQAFAALWRAPPFAPVRQTSRAHVQWLPAATHTFAGAAQAHELAARCLAFVAACEARWSGC